MILGKTLFTSHPYVSTLIFEPTASITSIVSVFFNSQGLASKTYGFDVRAPTGHKSITFSDSFDESPFAKKIAYRLDINHHVVFIDNFLEELPKAIKITQKPFWDLHWYHIAKEAKKYSKNFFSGDGGDELFAGYNRYQWAGKFALTSKILPNPIRTLEPRYFKFLR